jgi:bacillithiol system protein YtxJ
MESTLQELTTVEDLDMLLDYSIRSPVLLFKHSSTCAISWRALRELHAFLGAGASVVCGLITVQTARAVSNEAASRLGVKHETPQAIVIQKGLPVWSASHFDITAERLEEASRLAGKFGP